MQIDSPETLYLSDPWSLQVFNPQSEILNPQCLPDSLIACRGINVYIHPLCIRA